MTKTKVTRNSALYHSAKVSLQFLNENYIFSAVGESKKRLNLLKNSRRARSA